MSCWTIQSEYDFLPVLIFRFFFHQAFLIIGSHIVFNSLLSLLSRSLWLNICAGSLRRLILQCSALSIISTSSHKGRWFPFSFRIWPTIPDFSISPRTTALRCSCSLRATCLAFEYFTTTARDGVNGVLGHFEFRGWLDPKEIPLES